METQAVTGSHSSTTPIQAAGGHTSLTGGSNTHTQDFFVGAHKTFFSFSANSTHINSHIHFELTDIVDLIQAGVACYQTYKVNSITQSWFWMGWTPIKPGLPSNDAKENTLHALQGDLILYVAPYSRSVFESGTANQAIPARALPGCQCKFFPYRTYANVLNINQAAYTATGPTTALEFDSGWNQRNNLLTLNTQAQVLEITNDNPQYSIGTFGPTQNSASLSGGVYCNGPLGIQTRQGTDETEWHGFVFEMDVPDAVSVLTTVNFYWITKINITFEGTRWEGSILSSKLPPLLGDYLGGYNCGRSITEPVPTPHSGILYDFSGRPRRTIEYPTQAQLRVPEVQQDRAMVSCDVESECEDQADLPGGGRHPSRCSQKVQTLHQRERRRVDRKRCCAPLDDRDQEATKRRHLQSDCCRYTLGKEVPGMLDGMASHAEPNNENDEPETPQTTRHKVPLHLGKTWYREVDDRSTSDEELEDPTSKLRLLH